jgi:uncharacterized membrane-anchored protein
MKLMKFPASVLALSALVIPSVAEVSLSLDLKPAPTVWITGPDKTSLADVAELEIPAGYRFTDAKGARTLLENMKNPVPKNLAGILALKNNAGWIMFEFTDIGYVRPDDAAKIDADALLKTIRETTEQQNQHRALDKLEPVAVVEWERKPVYDAERHALQWAIRAEYGPDAVVNHTVRLLARKGALDAIAVQPASSATAGLAALEEVLDLISFNAGERYADYQEGDKIAASGLIELMNDDATLSAEATAEPDSAKQASNMLKSSVPWIVLSAVGLSGIVMLRRRGKHKLRAQPTHASPPAHRREPVKAPIVGSKNGDASQHSNGTAHQSSDSQKVTAGHRLSRRKKRMFNYQKFYTDMMMQSAAVTYSSGLSLKNGNRLQVNGNGSNSHEHTNGNGKHDGDSLNETLVLQATSDLIASQKTLIHEQARLIEDQSRLIEEKYRLLEKQSELLGAELAEH